jgi:hypothetical protein
MASFPWGFTRDGLQPIPNAALGVQMLDVFWPLSSLFGKNGSLNKPLVVTHTGQLLQIVQHCGAQVNCLLFRNPPTEI